MTLDIQCVVSCGQFDYLLSHLHLENKHKMAQKGVAPDEQAAQSAATPVPSRDSRAPQAPASPRTEAQECPICLESLTETGATMLTTSCGHQFCASCLRAATARSAACPLCRGRAHACLEKNRDACALCRADIPSIKEIMRIDSAASTRLDVYTRCTNVWVALFTILCVMFLIYCSFGEILTWFGVSSQTNAGRLDRLYSVPLWAIAIILIFISLLNIMNGAVCAHHIHVRRYTAALSQGARVTPLPHASRRPELEADPDPEAGGIPPPPPQLPV